MRVFAALVMLSAGCTTQQVRSSALAPHAAPGWRSGRAMNREVEISIGTPTAGRTRDPSSGDDNDPGLHIPEYHTGAAVRVSPYLGYDVGLLWDQGWGDKTTSIDSNQPDWGSRDVWGGGLSIARGATEKEGFGIGGEIQLWLYGVPYLKFQQCMSDCPPGEPIEEVVRGYSLRPVGVATVTPSWQLGRVTAYASFTLRNHPTVDRTDDGGVDDTGVDTGPGVAVIGMGGEVEVAWDVRVNAQFYYPFEHTLFWGPSPVSYGPMVSLWLNVPLSPKGPRLGPRREDDQATPAPTPLPAAPVQPQPVPQPPPQPAPLPPPPDTGPSPDPSPIMK